MSTFPASDHVREAPSAPPDTVVGATAQAAGDRQGNAASLTPVPSLTPELGVQMAAAVTGMDLAYLSAVSSDQQYLRAVDSRSGQAWPPFLAGTQLALADTLCARLLDGAPTRCADVPLDPRYSLAPIGASAGVRSYAGVPVLGLDGDPIGTLCALDRTSVDVGDRALDALVQLAPLLAPELASAAPVGIWLTRVPGGWRVGGLPGGDSAADDLVTATVLADLFAEDLASPGTRPPRAAAADDEVVRLRLSVSQLEHALAARVVVEQAIGVLAERRRIAPRAAFETLRSTARGTGRRVHAVATEVVASTSGTEAKIGGSLERRSAAPSPAAVASTLRSRRPAMPASAPGGEARL